MRDQGTKVHVNATGPLGLLGVVFVTLKLIGIQPVSGWSWWWVTAPFWGGLAIVMIILLGCGIVYLVALGVEKYRWRKRRK